MAAKSENDMKAGKEPEALADRVSRLEKTVEYLNRKRIEQRVHRQGFSLLGGNEHLRRGDVGLNDGPFGGNRDGLHLDGRLSDGEAQFRRAVDVHDDV